MPRALVRVANPPGMGGRLPEFNSISRLPPDVAREIIISPGMHRTWCYIIQLVADLNIEIVDHRNRVEIIGLRAYGTCILHET